MKFKMWKQDIVGSVQDCSNSIANTLGLLLSCIKPSIYSRVNSKLAMCTFLCLRLVWHHRFTPYLWALFHCFMVTRKTAPVPVRQFLQIWVSLVWHGWYMGIVCVTWIHWKLGSNATKQSQQIHMHNLRYISTYTEPHSRLASALSAFPVLFLNNW